MSLWKIAWRSLQQRALGSTLTCLSMALGVALVVTVLIIDGVVTRQFSGDAQGYHLIVGAKGGKLQLVLNTVYHLSQPIENIPYSFYKEFTEGEYASMVDVAVPYCLGDSYRSGGQSFRVVGTSPDLFDKLIYRRDVLPDGTPVDRHYEFVEGGRNFREDAFFEAVIGSVVASQTGLKVGDTFHPSHGISERGEGHEHDAFTIVGILKPTGTANDRAMFINLEGFYLLDGHAKEPPAAAEDGEHGQHDEQHEQEHEREEHDHGDHEHEGDHYHVEPLPESQREVTAVLVKFTSPLYQAGIRNAINEGRIAQAVYPQEEVTMLLDTFVAPLRLVLLVLTVLVVVVASMSVLVGIYNSMNERSHDIAVMRALGASRASVMLVILFESILLALLGGGLGVLLGHGLVGLASPLVVARTGVQISMVEFDYQELVLVPGLVMLAVIVGLLPALAAYKTDVAKSLGDS